MIKFLKDLFWYGLGTLFLIFISITMYFYMYNEAVLDNIYFLLIMILFVVLIYTQIIIMMISSIKKKEYKDTLLVYFLNVFYIPLYYGIKRNGVKKIGIVFLILNIILYLICMFIPIKYIFNNINKDDKYSYNEMYIIDNYNVKVVPNDKWLKEEDFETYDLELYLDNTYAGIWCYDYDEIADDLTYEDILNINIDNLKSSMDSFEIVEDNDPEEIDNKIIDSVMYKINYNGVDIYCYFNIIDDFKNEKMVYIVFSTEVDDYYDELKLKHDNLVDSIIIE